MSFPAMDAAMRAARLTSSEKFVLVSLAWHLNDKSGACYPSLSSIVADTGFSKNTVRTALAGLEKAGYLVRKKSLSENGRVSKTDYTLCFPNPLTVVSTTDISTTDISTTDISTIDTGCINHCTTLYQPLHHLVSTIDTKQGNKQGNKQGIELIDAAASDGLPFAPNPIPAPVKQKPLSERCPAQKIADAFNEVLGATLSKVQILNSSRRQAVAARWAECVKAGRFADETSGIEFFKSFFESVKKSSFLMGKCAPSGGRSKPFAATFDWLLTPTYFARVLEGQYTDRASAPQRLSSIDRFGNYHETPITSRDYSKTPGELLRARYEERLQNTNGEEK